MKFMRENKLNLWLGVLVLVNLLIGFAYLRLNP